MIVKLNTGIFKKSKIEKKKLLLVKTGLNYLFQESTYGEDTFAYKQRSTCI